MSAFLAAIYHAVAMLWMTFWALVLGFGISAALQVFVSKERMNRAFGQTNVRTMATATALGAASSSCSFAAAAAARSAVKQGAAFIPALAFMFASTNLVIEMGIVLWTLMGWQFVLAEVVGAFVLIGTMWMLAALFLPASVERSAREHATAADGGGGDSCCHHEHEAPEEHAPQGKWRQLATAFLMDWKMLWKEIVVGFLIAGSIAAFVPPVWWKALFIETGSAPLRIIENALVGPVIAIASFVCSVGNIPLASLLWANGISFGGVISFIYADLLVVPLILIYRKYYGGRAAAYLAVIFYVSMVVAGIVVDLLFAALGIVPDGATRPNAMAHAMIQWNYTTWLDIAALAVFALMLFLAYSAPGDRRGAHHHHH